MVSRIAVMVQPSGPASAGGSPTFWRFQATRQRAEQNRACSRRGANNVPHCSHFRVSVITLPPAHVTRNSGPFPDSAFLSPVSSWRDTSTAIAALTEETARQKVQAAEDAWNTRDPE